MYEFDAMMDALDAQARDNAKAEEAAEARENGRHAYWRELAHEFKEEELLPGYCWRCGRKHEGGGRT